MKFRIEPGQALFKENHDFCHVFRKIQKKIQAKGKITKYLQSKAKMKKILVIEDDLTLRKFTAEILSLAGFEVMIAENGKVGIELAKKRKPDLIICDIMMPEIDGFGVQKILSMDPSFGNVPFIFLTGKSNTEDMRKGMNSGADDYLIKPISKNDLLDSVESRLKKVSNLKIILRLKTLAEMTVIKKNAWTLFLIWSQNLLN